MRRRSHYSQHTLNGQERATHEIRIHFHAGLKITQGIAQFLERIETHERAFAAVAIFVSDVVEAASGGDTFEGIIDAALGHHDEFLRGTRRYIFDDGRG